MRVLLAFLLATGLAWGAYVAAPYWALARLSQAVQSGDEAGVAALINVRALRLSLARHLAAEVVGPERTGSIGGGDAQLAANALAIAADPLLQAVLTPKGVTDLLRRPAAAGLAEADRTARPFEDGSPIVGRLAAVLGASSWRGFRAVSFHLPPGAPRAERFRLQFRLARLSWRLVGIELPPDLRRRLGAEIVERVRRP